MPLHGRTGKGVNPNFMGAAGGLYVGQFYSTNILAYAHQNSSNGPPTCAIPNVLFPNDVASDDKADVIDPDGGSKTIMVFKGHGKCGSLLGTINDPYGQPVDASSQNAQTGTIAVANLFSTFQGGGTISLCTLSGGCTSNLTNSNMYEVIGVAMSRGGDCWATSYDSGGTPWLTYFAGCAGAGQTATGWSNSSPGGLDIDKSGNIVSLDPGSASVDVYSGCNPTCTLVAGPIALQGEAVYGHVNRQSMALATADVQNGQIDVYDYDIPSSISYEFSFNNGLTASDEVLGVAYAPRSHE
ncbi:MAG TPA: hypothetical protein VEW74_02775 [Candidatus Nitrosotalea sp.]|nr:hypothetical protein [Candidatus Nitrosotalea sp.]